MPRAILPESLDQSARGPRKPAGSPRSVALAKALQPHEVGSNAKENSYSAREVSNEDLLFGEKQKSSHGKGNQSSKKQDDASLGPLELSMELEQLNIGDSSVSPAKRSAKKEKQGGLASPTSAENVRPQRSVRFVNQNDYEVSH